MPRLYFLTSATCTWAVVCGMRPANLLRSNSGYAEQEQRDHRGDVGGVAEDSCCGEQGILPLLSGGRIREPVPVPGHQRPSAELRHLRPSFVDPRDKSAGAAPEIVSAGPRDAEKTTPPPPPTAASPSTLTSSSTVPPPPTAASTSPPASKNKTENAEFGVSNCDSCGLAECCGGASGTSSTTTTTLGATPGAHTTTVAATTSSTTPSPLDLDLCFVFDTTGSMGAYLEQLKQKITGLANDIVRKVREHMPDLPPEKMPRYAVVPYKDFSDPSHLSRSTILDFTGDTNKLSASIQPITATGGGMDTAEDILGAVHTATETLAWESKIRFLVVVTDAPGHGPELYDGPSDTQTPSGRWSDDPPPTVDVAMKRLQSQSINLIFVTCNAAATRKTEHAMRDHYNNEEREMTSLPLKSAEGFIEKIRELVVNKLIGRDHV